MAFEYQMLAVMTLFFLFAWLPSSLAKYQSFGTKWLASNRTPIPNQELEPWGARAERAYNNLKDYFPAFVVAILLLGHLNKFDPLTSWCSGIYVSCRFIHMAGYIGGSVFIRASSWTMSMIVNVLLLIKVFI